jgi:hypothetical protein
MVVWWLVAVCCDVDGRSEKDTIFNFRFSFANIFNIILFCFDFIIFLMLRVIWSF